MTMKTKHGPAVTWLTAMALLFSLCASLTLSGSTTAQSKDQKTGLYSHAQFATDYPALAKYATDITRLANQNKLEPVTNHEADIARVIDCLAREISKDPL